MVRRLVGKGHHVVNLDKLTYSGNLASLEAVVRRSQLRFVQADIADHDVVAALLSKRASTRSCTSPPKVMSTAQSTDPEFSLRPTSPARSNIERRARLLALASKARRATTSASPHLDRRGVWRPAVRQRHVHEEPLTRHPRYSASKAAADHFVRAWHDLGLPVVLSNCSNNYGPYHFPEKLIRWSSLTRSRGSRFRLWKGENVRDWLHVEDHAAALELVLTKGRIGQSYNVGGRAERTNLQVSRRSAISSTSASRSIDPDAS